MSPSRKPLRASRATEKRPQAGEVRAFATPKVWRSWLARRHASSPGIWIKFYKKESGIRSITYAQALDEALCWGWIDGRANAFDATAWVQRFTPRRPRSSWSKRNRTHVARLIEERRMQPSGLAQVEAARADGRWDRAYDSPGNSAVPADLLEALARHEKADAFFQTLNRANLYAITYRLQTAKKPETRARRFEQILQMMKDGKKFH
jgi:uncharacterized protein YdeI (YjbR/CyaY-like superfamily)